MDHPTTLHVRQVRSILESLPAERQTAMFSATWPEEVQELAEEFAGDYTFMNIGSTELSANKDIRQKVHLHPLHHLLHNLHHHHHLNHHQHHLHHQHHQHHLPRHLLHFTQVTVCPPDYKQEAFLTDLEGELQGKKVSVRTR